jgi:hypothetical protein
MPIKLTFDHPNRLILGVASGVLTLPEVAGFAGEIVRDRLLHYCKLIDVANSTPGFTKAELAAFVRVLRHPARQLHE